MDEWKAAGPSREPAPEHVALHEDCGGLLFATGHWPHDRQVGDILVRGALVKIECAGCGEEFGPLVFIARTPEGNVYEEKPNDDRLNAMRKARRVLPAPTKDGL